MPNRVLAFCFVAFAAVTLSAQRDPLALRTFDTDPVGQQPPGFLFAETRDAGPRRWTIERDAVAGQHLVHAAEQAAGPGFAVAVLEGLQLAQLEVSAKLRLVDGDRMAGVVWRYQDPSNYYFARLQLAGQQSVAVYRMTNGNRVRLEDEDDLELDPSAWHTLRVVQGDTRTRVYLGGIRVFELRDRSVAVSGGVGVWCAANSTAWFDDVRVEPRNSQNDRPSQQND